MIALPDVAETVLVDAAREQGVRVEGMGSYRIAAPPTGGSASAMLLLGYGRLAEAAIPAAVASLAEATRRAAG